MCGLGDVFVLIILAICDFRDLKKREIPISLLIIMSIGVLVIAFCCDAEPVWSRCSGAFIGILFFIISKCTKEAVGYGDSWLILILGVHLGLFKAVQLLFVASLAAGVCSLFFLWKHHWKRSATIPFVPFLLIAYIGVMFI